MKRIISFISIIAVAILSAVSCEREASVAENQQNGVLKLRFQTAEMDTKATIAGEGAENTIEHIDYFFFENDDPSSTAIVSGRMEVSELTKKSEVEYEAGFDTETPAYEKLKGPSYVYVLANYPEAVSVKTLNELLALPLTADFTKAQTSFVMDSYDEVSDAVLTYLTPKKEAEERTQVIKLRRVAAKIVLNINVKETYTDSVNDTWKPDLSQMWFNFLYGRNAATVAGEPLAYDAASHYYTTAQGTPAGGTLTDGYYKYTTDPVYVYPQSFQTSDITAPYFKIFIPWVSQKKGLNNFYYKVMMPEMESFQRNKVYTLNVDVSVIGGTEDDYALVEQTLYVADWWAPSAIETSFEGAMYLSVPTKKYEIYGENSITVPVVSSNPLEVTLVSATKLNLYNPKAGSINMEDGTNVYSDDKNSFTLTHTLNNKISDSNFDCTPITYVVNVKHAAGGLSKTETVTIVQYPSIIAEADESNGYAYVNSYTYGNAKYDNQTGTNRGGRWSSYLNGNKIGYRAFNNNSQELGTINNGNSTNSNYNQYVVTVSVLPDGYKVKGMSEEVVIGDPRGRNLTNDYLGYNAGTSGGRNNDVKNSYKAVSANTQNVIAPKIRIASSWGATSPIYDYDRAEERCASYQENGYPAGRWRIPTVAEIDFLISLSDYKHIPELFSPSIETYGYDVYWAGGKYGYGGKPYAEENDSHQSYVDLSNAEQYSRSVNRSNYTVLRATVNGSYQYFRPYMRCVYDEWYWGSEKYNNNGQKITGTTGTAATQWLGYIF